MSKHLLKHAARRLILGALLILLVSSSGLILARLAPGDFTSELIGSGVTARTIARERARHGVDRPLVEQYVAWLGRAVRFDFGTSIRYGRPVRSLVVERAKNTAGLATLALLLAFAIGVPMGVWSGSTRTPALRRLIESASVVGVSLPPLLTSLVFVLVAARTGWFPIGGMMSLAAENATALGRLADFLWHAALPASAIAIPIAATLERMQSQAMRDTMAQPFVRAAAARGVPQGRIVWVHALKASIPPIVAIFGVIVGGVLSGSFAVEIVMAWPGLGRLLYEALVARDMYLVAGCGAAGAVFLALSGLVADVTVAAIDPRQEAGA